MSPQRRGRSRKATAHGSRLTTSEVDAEFRLAAAKIAGKANRKHTRADIDWAGVIERFKAHMDERYTDESSEA